MEIGERFCRADPMQMAVATMNIAKWPTPECPFSILDELPGVDFDQFKATALWGLSQWSKYSALKVWYTDRAAEARLLIRTRRIDGPGKVLADCELPMGQKQLVMRIDLGDEWDAGIDTPVTRLIKLGFVIWHEGGHSRGMGHAPDGSPNAMAPIYNPKIKVAGPWDVQQIQMRDGKPSVVPPTPPPNTPTLPGGTGMFQVLLKLLPVIQWFIANKDQLAPLLDALKKIFDAFQAQPKAALAMGIGADRSTLKALLAQWAATLKATSLLTSCQGDDVAAELFENAVKTDWLLDLVFAIIGGQLTITDELLAAALAGDTAKVQALVA